MSSTPVHISTFYWALSDASHCYSTTVLYPCKDIFEFTTFCYISPDLDKYDIVRTGATFYSL